MLWGFVPILGNAIKGTRVGLKLRDLGRMVDELATGMAKTFNKTEEASKAFWKRKEDMKAYEDALKACDGSRKCLDVAALKKGSNIHAHPKAALEVSGIHRTVVEMECSSLRRGRLWQMN